MNDLEAKTAMNKQLREWFWWTAATTGGWLLGTMLNILLSIVLSLTGLGAYLNADPSTVPQSMDLILLVVSLALLLVIGISAGALQGLILRRHVAGLQRWAIFTGLGFALGYIVFPPFMGVGVGLLQWLLLRRDLNKTSWWALINALAWPVGFIFGGSLGSALGAALNSPLLSNLLGAGLTGIIIGATTGAVLLWLLRENAALLESLRQDKELVNQ